MGFGQTIRDLRLKKRLAQPDLAKLVGIHETYLSKIENGRVSPPAENVIRKLASTLGVPFEHLMLEAPRIPSSYAEQIAGDPLVADFMRTAGKLSPYQRRRIKEILCRI